MMTTNYDVDLTRFEPYGKCEPVIKSDSNNYKLLNWSNIRTKLIQLAGRLCNHYASDIIIDINSIQRKLEDGELKDSDFFLFGFREMGVDHNAFIECKRENELSSTYREIWKLEVVIDDETRWDQIRFLLYRVDYSVRRY